MLNQEDVGVYLWAGLAAHLAGAVAAHTTRPVIGVPNGCGPLSGFDALLSTVQMPPGIPVATVAVGRTGAKMRVIWQVRYSRLAMTNSPNVCRKIGHRIGRKWQNKTVRFRRP
ncbi:MAG: hypothetical protein CM1200mP9_00030 [Gammaproteobacteria bacterium]|nr:MAG: hypothetical protein CM1200mP9_00030 [Gammaproteobacteria bacterium]